MTKENKPACGEELSQFLPNESDDTVRMGFADPDGKERIPRLR